MWISLYCCQSKKDRKRILAGGRRVSAKVPPVGRPRKTRPAPLTEDEQAEQARRLALGARVRAVRESRGWSLRDLAERAQLASNAIYEIENGAVDPRTGTMDRLARALECDLAELLRGAPHAPKISTEQ